MARETRGRAVPKQSRNTNRHSKTGVKAAQKAISKAAPKRKPKKYKGPNDSDDPIPDVPDEPQNPDLEDAVVGLDFGTQNTCVAIRRDAAVIDQTTPLNARLNQITIVQGWKGYRADPGILSTAIMYHKHGNQAGWGNGVINYLADSDVQGNNNNKDLIDVITLPKLALHKSDKSKRIFDNIGAIASRRAVRPRQFAQDFLDNTYKELMEPNGYFDQYYPNVQKRKVTFIVGCPPSWNDREGEVLLKMAKQAGMTNSHLGSEGEAIAVFYLSQNMKLVRVDQRYMVVDMGAGTVDLVVYKVLKVDPLELQEETVADSVLCGGVFMDELFRSLIKEKYPNATENNLDWMVRKFQEMKQNFDGRLIGMNDSMTYNIPILGQVVATSDEIRIRSFDPIIQQIIEATEHVRERANIQDEPGEIKMIFGGGLSHNEYVMNRLRAHFGNRQGGGEFHDIIKIPDFAAPNARGMLMLGPTTNPVKQRRCKVTVGIYTIGNYDKKLHIDAAGKVIPKKDCAYQDEKNPNLWWVHEMRWLLRRDDLLDKTKEPIDFPRHIQLGSNTDEMTELIFWGPCSPPACDAHRNFSILPDADVDDYDDDVQMERAEKRMAREMGMSSQRIRWMLPDDFDKNKHFKNIGTEDGEFQFEANWNFVFTYEKDDVYLRVDLKDKNNQIILSTDDRAMKIILDPAEKDYLALGTLSSRPQGGRVLV